MSGAMLHFTASLLYAVEGYPTRSNSACSPTTIVLDVSLNASLERLVRLETSTNAFVSWIPPSSSVNFAVIYPLPVPVPFAAMVPTFLPVFVHVAMVERSESMLHVTASATAVEAFPPL